MVQTSERPERPPQSSPGRGGGAKPRSLALGCNPDESSVPWRGTTIRTRGGLHPFRVPFRGWPVTQGGARGFALRFALGCLGSPLSGRRKGWISRVNTNLDHSLRHRD